MMISLQRFSEHVWSLFSVLVAWTLITGRVQAQTTLSASKADSIRNDSIQKARQNRHADLLQLHGGISLNGIYQLQSGLRQDQRQPYTYYANGNLSARIARLVDVGISFSLTNTGNKFTYPTLPSRFSINPQYKWVTGHFGNIAMVFSPYTLNGHLCSGAGVDLNPTRRWRISAMYGRLQKASPYDSANRTVQAAYRRIGYGAKIGYLADSWRLGGTFFSAKDDPSSIATVPDSLGISPLQNLVVSVDAGLRILRGLEFVGEYANSAINSDRRDTAEVTSVGSHLLKPLIGPRASTAYHSAIKGGLNYAFSNSVIGVSYERVDPGYRTLGAYYFNNDLESYTLNLAQKFLQGRMSVNGSLGYQHDNLDKNKSSTNKRTVGSLTATYTPSRDLFITGSYSNFLTYLNLNPQFRKINQLVPYEVYDTLNFTQFSQNAIFNLNWVFRKSETRSHTLSSQLSLFGSSDKASGAGSPGSTSRLYNGAFSYNLQFIPAGVSLNAGLNVTHNQVGGNEFRTIGPLAGANALLFNKKLQVQLSFSYNKSTGASTTSEVFNSRLGASYRLGTYNSFNLMLMSQQRKSGEQASNILLGTAGYSLYF